MSFHYYRKHDMAELAGTLHGFRLFADSGAYSAKSVGAPVQLDEYMAWLRQWRHLFNIYVNLDVIGDAAGTWRNQLEMERQGFHPVPVFHAGEPWEYLDRYLDAGHPYIALGGMVGAPAALKRWIIACFKRAQGRAVFHGFGRTNLADIADFPWYSVDSSSWGMGYRYGTVNLFERGRWVKVKVGDHAGVYRHAALVRAHGVAPERLADRSLYHWRYAAAASAVAWHRLGEWAHARHAPVTLPEAEDGPHLYLADTATGVNLRLPVAAEAIRADPGPHLFLAEAAGGSIRDRLATASDAIRAQPGPHLYLADGAATQLQLGARAIREAGS